jgi:alkylation response protein AidB-like acyl-CoA dehydrogenase
MTTAVRTGGAGAGGVSVLVIPTNSPGFSARKIKNSGANAGGSFLTLIINGSLANKLLQRSKRMGDARKC